MSTPSPQAIRVFIVDDHAMMRTGLRLFLENQPELAVVGEAATCTEALTVVSDVQPDMIVLDLDLGKESAIGFIPELLAAVPQARILILTGVRDPDLHQRALSLGAIGLVPKEQLADVLLQAIVKVHAGEAWIEPSMMASVLGAMVRVQRPDPEAARIATLTARERDIIALIGEGLKNRQIATRLHISETTVRHHLTSIFSKLGVVDRLDLLVYIHRHDLLEQR
jgi:DNA-binding NarL/FixJ family response regulator